MSSRGKQVAVCSLQRQLRAISRRTAASGRDAAAAATPPRRAGCRYKLLQHHNNHLLFAFRERFYMDYSDTEPLYNTLPLELLCRHIKRITFTIITKLHLFIKIKAYSELLQNIITTILNIYRYIKYYVPNSIVSTVFNP